MEEEKKKESFFGEIEKSKWKQVVLFCVSMIVMIAIYLPWKQAAERKIALITENYSWVYQVDSMESNNGKIEITGWAFALEQDAGENKFEIVLHNMETEKNIFPKMNYEAREDVNEYFLCEYDYTQSGFTATFSEKKLDEGVYEIFLKLEGSRNAYSTGIYYADGIMTFVNPEEFTPLDIAGTDLEQIVEQGVLRVYRPDYGMYVYQYAGELYWIAEEWYDFVDDNTFVQYQMNTTQVENLPEDRLVNNWLWGNHSFYFDTKELTGWNTGKYRVTKCELPMDYSVTLIWTGNHIDGWIWQTYFRPWYEFSIED